MSRQAVLPNQRKRPVRPGTIVRNVVVVLLGIGFIFPLLWTLFTSLSSDSEVYQMPPKIKPPTRWGEYVDSAITNYGRAWSAAPWPRYFLNTIFLAGCVVALVLITSLLAGFAFSRMTFRGRNVLFLVVMGVMMVPSTVLLIPNFLLAKSMGLYDTYLIQILPFAASVFGIFLLRQFFMTLPQEMFEAAEIDGAGPIQMVTRIAGPLAVPTLILIGLNSFMGAWNAFVWPYLMTQNPKLRPIEVGLQTFMSTDGTDWTGLSAAVVFTTLPVIILFVFLQKYFVQGAFGTEGAVKN